MPRWNFEQKIGTAHPKPEDKKLIQRADLESPVKEVPELEKARFEKLAIIKANEALGKILSALDLESISIPPDHIHLLSKEEWHKLKKRGGGMVNGDHVYLLRKWEDRGRFLMSLLHEIAHAASYYAVGIEVRKETENKPPLLIFDKRRGFAFEYHPERHARPYRTGLFSGLNEGVTDLLANEMKHTQKPDWPLSEKEMEGFADQDHFTYFQPLLIERIIRDVASKDKPQRDWYRQLFRDYFQGTYEALKALEKKRKGIAKILANMKNGRQEVIIAARALGYEDLAEKLATLV